MDHSYEEIRQTAIAALAKLDHTTQYLDLKRAVGREFELRGDNESRRPRITPQFHVDTSSLSDTDANLLLEVFWNLFREGIITLGINDQNASFPWFRISEFGKKVLDNQDPYFFQDVSTYETLIKARVPQIDPITLIYLKEAVQAFKSGCVLSASVMIGVAAEHSFLILLEAVEANASYSRIFGKAYNERSILRKLNTFKRILDQNLNVLPARAKEDLDTQFMATASMIRNFRNESGHPSGRIIEREQCYILLQLFVPCCEKIYQLIDVF